MAQFSGFDRLPLVVHDAILHSLASPWDVANLIRASPGSLQAYTTGSQGSVLLSALRNVLSLETQHLMNMVVAASYHMRTGQWFSRTTTGTKVELEGIASLDEFKKAGDCFFEDFDPALPCPEVHLHHLSLNTIDYSIRLFAVIHKAIQTYSLYTMARAQRRVTSMSGPQSFAFLSTHFVAPALQDVETERLWRGFLTFELYCVICGRSLEPRFDVRIMTGIFFDVRDHVLEELICVYRYVCEQYVLAFNEVVESFSLAVARMGQRTASATDSANSLPGKSLRLHRFPGRFQGPDSWSSSMAMLGPSFLQGFLSHDATARLHCFRATFRLLDSSPLQGASSPYSKCFNGSDLKMNPIPEDWADLDVYHHAKRRLRAVGWIFDELDIDHHASRRLRAVGWAFWDDPDRLASMDLVPGRLDAAYGHTQGAQIPSVFEHRGDYDFFEKPTEEAREAREQLARDFGTTVAQPWRGKIKRRFGQGGSLKFSDIISVVPGPYDQEMRGTGAETTVSDGSLEQKPGGSDPAPTVFVPDIL